MGSKCPAGTSHNTTSKSRTHDVQCLECPAGRYNKDENGNCKVCPTGQYAKGTKKKGCVKCPGDPPCLGRGVCDNKIGACVHCGKHGTGWTGTSCALCGIKWSNTNGKCNSCSDQFQF